jgi:uncharacterized membrane protein
MLSQYWERVSSGFWFVPSILVGGSVVLAWLTLALDEAVSSRWARERGWIYAGGADGAETILGTIAGSMITIAGVVFSLTLVALTLASSQFGPRLLRNFMRDTTNQVVIGTFISTFMYCLIVLRSINHEEPFLFVPHLSVSFAVFLALANLGVLIYFIHHVAKSIQADEVIARVASELFEVIDRLFPEQIGEEGPRPPAWDAASLLPEGFDREARTVVSPEDGYLQAVDPDALLKLAAERDLVLRLERRPGHYVVAGCPLVRAWPGAGLGEEFDELVIAAFMVGDNRTPLQDVEFSINQLVEISIRALSPGVNDTFTPVTCLDRLGSAFCRLARREMPSPYRLDGENRLRVIAHPVTFPGVFDAAFSPIRRNARTNVVVTIRMLETIEHVAGAVCRPEDRRELERQARMIRDGAREALPEPDDRRAVQERYDRALRRLGTAGRPDAPGTSG